MNIVEYFEKNFDSVLVVSSTKSCGNLSFKWSGPNVIENRESLFEELGLDLDKLVLVNQPHGREVVIVDSLSAGRGSRKKDWVEGYDGLVTSDKNIILGVESADCLPIFGFDSKGGIIGVVHAGWQGVVSGVVETLIDKMKDLGSQLEDIKIQIGPHIKVCCFEVQSNIIDKFSAWPKSVLRREGKSFVDLSQIVVDQLTSIGVLRQNVNIETRCTCCFEDKYYSYRRDKEENVGAMLSLIKLKR